MNDLNQAILIPAHARGVLLARLLLSTRLANVLQHLGYQWLGDLDGKNYQHIFRAKNCGSASIEELKKLVKRLSFDELQYLNKDQARELLSHLSQAISIPAHAHEVALSRLPLSVSLELVLQDLGYQTVGDLDGKSYRDISNGKNCGVMALGELQALVGQLNSADGNFLIEEPPEEAPPVRREKLSLTISIPAHAHQVELSWLPLSMRLGHVLTSLDCWSLGDLHGKSYDEILAYPHCGRKTIHELAEVIRRVVAGELPKVVARPEPARDLSLVSQREPLTLSKSVEIEPFAVVLSVPAQARDWPLAQFPLTTRLANVLEAWGCQRLSDLEGKTLAELWKRKNCGRQSLIELHELLQQVEAGGYDQFMESAHSPDLGQFILRLDERIENLPPRKREILISRLGGDGQLPLSLAEIAQQQGLTRERIRQLEGNTIEALRRGGGPAQVEMLNQLVQRCESGVCPLTAELLAHWLGATATDCRFALSFYLRFFAELEAQLPVWFEGQSGTNDADLKVIARRVRKLMSGEPASLPLPTVLAQLRALDSFSQTSPQAFFTALRIEPSLQVEFPHPERPTLAPVKLDRKLNTREWARLILAEAERAMKPEELVAAAQQKFGADFEPASVRFLEVHLPASEGFYLLGTRLVGLRQHIQLPESLWPQAKNELYDFWQQRKCATSAREAFGALSGDWTQQTNAHELACLLREDERFIEQSYFHFALAEWDQEERDALRARVTEVLTQLGHPLSLGELAPQVQRLLTTNTMPELREALPDHPEVCHYGHGYYGLKVWEEKRAYAFLVKEAAFVSDLVAGTEPPLTFAELCRLMKISPDGNLAERLWQTVHSLPRMRCRPDQPAPETLLWHRIWKFEYLLCAMLEKAGKPLLFARIQAKLNAGLKRDAPVPTDLARRLQQSRLFVCDDQGRYTLAAR